MNDNDRPSLSEQVERFFADYAACYVAEDASTVVDHLRIPFAFLSDSGPLVMPDRDAVLRNFSALVAQYRQLDIVDYHHRLRELQALSSHVCLVRLNWRFQRSDGSLVYASNTSYFLLLEPVSIRIMAILLHDEPEKKASALRAIHA